MKNHMCLAEDIDSSGGIEVDGFFRIAYEDVACGGILVVEDAASVYICLKFRIYSLESIDYLLRYLGD